MEARSRLPPGRLPRGRHGFSKELITEAQRERLMDAMTLAVSEKGYANVTIADLTAGAGVSRATFYELFSGKEACFAAAEADFLERLGQRVAEGYEAGSEWSTRIVAALAAALQLIAADPQGAQLAIVEAAAAGPAPRELLRGSMRDLTRFFDEGRSASDEASSLPAEVSLVVVGGVVAVLFEEIARARAEALPAMLPELAYISLVPYLGHRKALEAMESSRSRH